MKLPESYTSLIVLSICFILVPFISLSGGSIWWGFSYIPFLPVLLLVAFFLLPQAQYLPTVLLGGWWYDLISGSVGPTALVAVVISSFVLYGMSQLISSRSLLSDILIVFILYFIWIASIFSIGLLAQKITPMSPQVVITQSLLVTGIVGSLVLQLISRRFILRDNIVPKALS